MSKVKIGNIKGPKGDQGSTGPQGPQGSTGATGPGVPSGGSTGQIIAKNSSTSYDTGWVPMSAAAAAAFGIVEDGNTATHTISKGQYVIWKGALYTADAAIASGTTLAASGGNKNLTAVSGGGLNAIKASIDSLNSKISTYSIGNVASLSALESALDAFGSSLNTYERRQISINVTASFGEFTATAYVGEIYTIISGRYHVTFYRNASNTTIHGIKDSNRWIWGKYALEKA